jgi:hypothetical protein
MVLWRYAQGTVLDFSPLGIRPDGANCPLPELESCFVRLRLNTLGFQNRAILLLASHVDRLTLSLNLK